MTTIKTKIGKIPIYKGLYVSNKVYYILNQVTYNGSTYQSLIDNNHVLPTDNTAWSLIASKGDKGDKGDKGTDADIAGANVAIANANQAADRANGNLIEDVSSTAISLAVVENTTYKYGTLASLTITSIPNSNLPSFIYFNSGTTATTFAYPSGMKIRGYSVPVPNAGYVISIFNGVATIVKV